MIFETFCAAVEDTPRNARWLLALSGGNDSVALLTLARTWIARHRPDVSLETLHLQHHLRGEASEEDEEFCRQLTAQWRLPFHAVSIDPKGHAATSAQGIPAAARELRLGAFEEWARRRRATAVVTAHHRDDQSETVLLRALRGSGPRGLRGIRPRRPLTRGSAVELLRPCLALGKDQLREWRHQAGVPCREDQSNQERIQLRNRLRLDLLPALREQLSPEIDSWLLQISRAASQIDDRCLEARSSLERKIARAGPYCRIPLSALDSLLASKTQLAAWILDEEEGAPPIPAAGRSLALALELLAGDPSRRSVNLPGALRLSRVGDQAWVLPPAEAFDAPVEVPLVAGRVEFGPMVVEPSGPLPRGEWVIRSAQRGDRRSDRGTKVAEVLRAAGIPPDWRAHWPVISERESGAVIWIAGVSDRSTSLRVTWQLREARSANPLAFLLHSL